MCITDLKVTPFEMVLRCSRLYGLVIQATCTLVAELKDKCVIMPF